jgi:hypothetical protein
MDLIELTQNMVQYRGSYINCNEISGSVNGKGIRD